MTGIVALTMIMGFEDIDELDQRVTQKLQARASPRPRTDPALDEVGLDRHAALVPRGTAVTFRRQTDEAVPPLLLGWVTEAKVIRGDLAALVMGRQNLLHQAYLLGMLDEVVIDEA